MKTSQPLLSIVVPTRNEPENVRLLVSALQETLANCDFEIWFVDDSTDETPFVLQSLTDNNPAVHSILRVGSERMGGLSTAVSAGLRAAQGEFVCVMDADFQHPVETIPVMLQKAQEGADLVIGSRYVSGGSAAGLAGGVRQVVSRASALFAQIIFSEARRTKDPLSGFFLCRRTLVDGLELRPVGFKILLELLVCLPGINVQDVPMVFATRQYGNSKASLNQGLLFLRHIQSLFIHVDGSARLWKFLLVGGTGLITFLATLQLLILFSTPPLLAFLPAFGVSFLFNYKLNRSWTCADLRQKQQETLLRSAVISGLVMTLIYVVLLWHSVSPLWAGSISCLVGAVFKYLAGHSLLNRRTPAWARLTSRQEIQVGLFGLAQSIDADKVELIDAQTHVPTVDPEILRVSFQKRQPVLYVTSPSHRLQRRTNIEYHSVIVVPVIRNEEVQALLLALKYSPKLWAAAEMTSCIRFVETLSSIPLEE